MGDNLPLIPEKESMCADVRPILRAVFRELDYLPPLTTELPVPVAAQHLSNALLGDTDQWIEKYKSECMEICRREGELKRQHARRVAREPLPNIHAVAAPRSPPSAPAPAPRWRLRAGLIERHHLVPTLEQNAGRDGSLWIKNILAQSSGDVCVEVARRSPCALPRLSSCDDVATLQTLSIGALERRPPPPPPAPPPPAPQPDYIVCVPPQLDFVNFTIGHLHTQRVRLVNVSKFEIRLSVRPPKRRELDVQLCGPRGLTVTSGAAADIRVHFRPSDVRAVHDTLLVRVSMGRDFVVPIACYMQPPVLNILIPSVTSSLLSCSPGAECAEGAGGAVAAGGAAGDVLELGARLLGDVHCARVLLHCDAEHASFFLLTEDAWFSCSLDCLTVGGSVVASPFVVWPAWWGGGGAVRGCAWCHARAPGLHATALRLLSSTAVARPLHLLADVLLFRQDHLTILAHEKEYDICSDGEPACEYYVQLGTAFPHRSLSATVQLINHSPVVYSYYWSVRPWGACSCWEEDKPPDGSLCGGARESRDLAHENRAAWERRGESAALVLVEPARGAILPRATCALHVRVPDVGARLGLQRAVLMLILKDIPKESFPPDYEPMIVSTEEVDTESIPGVESERREVCEVVCAQMEVCWEVTPLRFVLLPPVMPLYHSRRLESVSVELTATQLFGPSGACVSWQTPEHVPAPAPLRLTPAQHCHTVFNYPLPSLPNQFPETDVITLVAENSEWQAQCRVRRQCGTRHPALRPARALLGVVPPGAHMHASFQLLNDTHEKIWWWAEAFRWWGENEPSLACRGRLPCEHCQERACSCALLRPATGALAHNHAADICYDVNAPERDGCVATLVRVRRPGADVAHAGSGTGESARAALVAYRVLAPRLVLRVLPCTVEPDSYDCSCCAVDAGAEGAAHGARGAALLRPRRALALGRRTCYRLRLTNITPLPTAVHFDRDTEDMDVLKVKFSPNDFHVRPYGEVEVRVVLEALRVCARRVFVCRARVLRAHRPLYLLVDTAIDGLKVSVEVPLGAGDATDNFVIMPRMQKEVFPFEKGKPTPSTPEEIFAEEDRRRLVINENKCRCAFEMVYVPPARPLRPPRDCEEHTPIEIVSTPPALMRVCACTACERPRLPELQQPICLQFTGLPLRTVRTRTLQLRNESVVTAHWSVTVRHHPRAQARTLAADAWACGVRPPGVALACSPARGVLAARATAALAVRAYADCWGLYRDQLLIQIAGVEPIVLDVWVEAQGAPLQLALQPAHCHPDPAPAMWVSAGEQRVLRARNTSRSALALHVYTAVAHEYAQDTLPFRLYLRYYDVPPRTCVCVDAFQSDLMVEQSDSCSFVEEVETGFEIYFAPDFGIQNDDHYTVSPEVCTLQAGESAEWEVEAREAGAGAAPDVHLLLRMLPLDCSGPGWQRFEPPPQLVRLRRALRYGRLKLSCCELRVRLCALDLPYGDVLRVRKRFHAINVGNGVLELGVETQAPWCMVSERGAGARHVGGEACDADCCCATHAAARLHTLQLRLEPNSSTEMCVEVSVSAAEVWPTAAAAAASACQTPVYPPRTLHTTPLHIFDDENILRTVPLVLDMEFPVLRVLPPVLDFGVVADGDTRKAYFSVSHSSRMVTLDIATQWIGGEEFKIWPPFLRIPPGRSENVYLQYTAMWRAAPSEGCARVAVCCGAGLAVLAPGGGVGAGCAGAGLALGQEVARAGWCRAAVAVRAAPARDHKFHVTRHDHTDDTQLLPPDVTRRASAPAPPPEAFHCL